MVIRDLTLRSAASFGSFHLIRLLYDEYMFYLVEHRVAEATGETPIAVMGEVRALPPWGSGDSVGSVWDTADSPKRRPLPEACGWERARMLEPTDLGSDLSSATEGAPAPEMRPGTPSPWRGISCWKVQRKCTIPTVLK